MLSTDQSCNREQLIYPILCLLILLQLGNKMVGMLLEVYIAACSLGAVNNNCCRFTALEIGIVSEATLS